MKVKDLMNQIEHINTVIVDIQKLMNLEEDFIYEIESKAGFESNIDTIVDVGVDVLESWKEVLQKRIENTEIGDDENV